MKIRILSGNQAGAVVEWSKIEAQCAITTGFAEVYIPPERVEPHVEPAMAEEPDEAPLMARKGRNHR